MRLLALDRAVVLSLLLCLGSAVGCARMPLRGPETTLDFALGVMDIDDADLETSIGTTRLTDRIDFNNGFSAHIRVIQWLGEAGALGVGLEGALFHVEGDDDATGLVNVEVFGTTVTPLIVLRYPDELVQPYVAVGPAIIFTETEVDVLGIEEHADTVEVGLDLRVGIRASLDPQLGVFAEFRHLEFDADYNDSGFAFEIEKLEFETNTFMIGISLSFGGPGYYIEEPWGVPLDPL